MTKTLDQNWIDWENHAFGFGYGSGEEHIIPALKRFTELCGNENSPGQYNYEVLEKELTPTVAWLLINILANHKVDMIEYGTSPRFGWLTERGMALKKYMENKTADELVELACGHDENYSVCYPDVCNCGPNGYEKGKHCFNPFWEQDAWRKKQSF